MTGSAKCTLQNIGFSVGSAILKWVDDVDVELELDADGDLRTVICKDADSKRECRITERSTEYCINQKMIWSAALSALEERGEHLREMAGVIKPKPRRPEYTGPEYVPLGF